MERLTRSQTEQDGERTTETKKNQGNTDETENKSKTGASVTQKDARKSVNSEEEAEGV